MARLKDAVPATRMLWRFAIIVAVTFGFGFVLGLESDRWLKGGDRPLAGGGSEPARATPPEARPERPSEAPSAREAAPAPEFRSPAPRLERRLAALPPESLPRTATPSLVDSLPPWRRFAVAAPATEGKAMIAVVIDDLGHNPARVASVVRLRAPLTLAFLPYGRDLSALAAEARRAGHEVLLHVPMEPIDPTQDPGPEALLTGLDRTELLRRLRWQMSRFEGYVGVNNHMGSRFSSDEAAMSVVMAEVRARGLLYVDSRTTAETLGSRLARRMGVPEIERDVFLDDNQTAAGVRRQLALLEETARRQGIAVAIGHPYRETLEALELWLAEADTRGFVLVPVSAIVSRRLAASSTHDRLSLEGAEALELERR